MVQPAAGEPLYVAGDLNVQLGAPRSEAEARDADRIGRWAGEQRLCCASLGAPTCAKDGALDRASEGDYVFVPEGTAGADHVAAAWHHHLSDHAWLPMRGQGPAQAAGRPCSPAAMRALPPGAAGDPRLRFGALAAVFGLSAADARPSEDLGVARWNSAFALGGALFLRHTVQS